MLLNINSQLLYYFDKESHVPFPAHFSVISKKKSKGSTRNSGSILWMRDISVGYKTEIHSRGSPRVREQDLLARISRGVAHRVETTAGNERRTRRRNSSHVSRILSSSVEKCESVYHLLWIERGSSRVRAAVREVINEDGYNSMTLKRLFPLWHPPFWK